MTMALPVTRGENLAQAVDDATSFLHVTIKPEMKCNPGQNPEPDPSSLSVTAEQPLFAWLLEL